MKKPFKDALNNLRSIKNELGSFLDPYEDAEYEPYQDTDWKFSELCAGYDRMYAKAKADYQKISGWQEQAALRLKKMEQISRSDAIQRTYYKSNGICDLLLRLAEYYDDLGEGESISPGVVHTLLELMCFELAKLQKLPSDAELEPAVTPTPEGYQNFLAEREEFRKLKERYPNAPMEEQRDILSKMENLLMVCNRKMGHNRSIANNLPPVVMPRQDTGSNETLLAQLMELYRIGDFENLNNESGQEPELCQTDTTARRVLAYAREQILPQWKPLNE